MTRFLCCCFCNLPHAGCSGFNRTSWQDMMLCGRVWPVFRGPGGQARKGPRSATPRAIHTPDTTGTIHSQQNSQRKNGGETGEVGKSNIVNRFLRKDKKCSCCMHHGSDSHCGVCPPPRGNFGGARACAPAKGNNVADLASEIGATREK